MQTVGLKSGDLGDAERRIQTTWEVNLSASIITQIQQIPNVCPCRILPDETGLQSILTKPITTDHGPCFSMIYLCDKLHRRHALVLMMMMIRTPQLVCILRKLKTKPNGCLGRSASWANHCECLPNQTSDSFSIWIWHTILYNSRRPMLRSMQTSWGVLALVEIVIHNVEGDVKIDIIMTRTTKP